MMFAGGSEAAVVPIGIGGFCLLSPTLSLLHRASELTDPNILDLACEVDLDPGWPHGRHRAQEFRQPKCSEAEVGCRLVGSGHRGSETIGGAGQIDADGGACIVPGTPHGVRGRKDRLWL